MKLTQNEFERVLAAWRPLYRERENRALELDGTWQADVMRAVRRIGPLDARPQASMLFGQLVWRLAPVTMLLIIVAAVILLKFNMIPGDNLLVSLITDVDELTISQLLPM